MEIYLKRRSGIYSIKNKTTGKLYIGSAVCLYTRIHSHFSMLKLDKHDNIHFQRLYRKYGVSDFCYDILEFCEKQELVEREQFYIDSMKPKINICKFAQSTLGYRHGEKMKARFSETRKGIQTKSMLGKSHSESTKRVLSEKAKKRPLPPLLLIRSREANLGRKWTEEMRRKIPEKQAKLSIEQVRQIREMLERGIYQKDIANFFGISQRLVCRVKFRVGYYDTLD